MNQLLLGFWMFLTGASQPGQPVFAQCSAVIWADNGATFNAPAVAGEIRYRLNGCDAPAVAVETNVTVRQFTTTFGDGVVDIPGVGVLQAHPIDAQARATIAKLNLNQTGRYHVSIQYLPFAGAIEITLTPIT